MCFLDFNQVCFVLCRLSLLLKSTGMYIVVYKVMFDIFEGNWLMFIDKKGRQILMQRSL